MLDEEYFVLSSDYESEQVVIDLNGGDAAVVSFSFQFFMADLKAKDALYFSDKFDMFLFIEDEYLCDYLLWNRVLDLFQWIE